METIYNKTIKNVVLFFIFSLFFYANGKAQSDSLYLLIEQGNKAYIASEFDKAIESYEQVIGAGYSSSELYYNLGNAYYRNTDYKSAILNYERALLISPDDENILANLEFARNHIQDRIEIIPKFFLLRWIDGLVKIFPAKTWAYISIASFILFLALVFSFLFARSLSLRKLAFFFSVLFLFVSAWSFYGAAVQNKKQTKHNEAIVFSPSVTVKSSPTSNGTDLFIIHEGLKVKVLDSTNGWKEIRLSDGKIGWLKEDAIVSI